MKMQKLSEHIPDAQVPSTVLTAGPQRLVIALCLLMLMPFDLMTAMAAGKEAEPEIRISDNRDGLQKESDEPIPQNPVKEIPPDSTVFIDAEALVREPLGEGDYDEASDTVPTVVVDENSPYGLDGKKVFNPSPTRAVWLSALLPGLGQVYNRRYWKLPIVVGAFMGLGYGTNLNNGQLRDYTQAYRDLMDNDPSTKSYMNFFPSTTKEEDLDKTWLTNTMRTRRDFYRRNRDLCIICIVGMYLLCMVDAYVDASLAHFDISPDLSIDWSPSMMINPSDRKVSLGLNWAFNF